MDMTDIFQNWKNNRFVIVDAGSSGLNIDGGVYPHLVVLADIGYWTEHYDELKAWCEPHGCKVQGMTVSLPDQPTATLFCLRWN